MGAIYMLSTVEYFTILCFIQAECFGVKPMEKIYCGAPQKSKELYLLNLTETHALSNVRYNKTSNEFDKMSPLKPHFVKAHSLEPFSGGQAIFF